LSLRDDGVDGSNLERRLARQAKVLKEKGLPDGFTWLVSDLDDVGNVTLSIVHTESGRIVLQGF
jgi:hypothetical protein